MSIYRNQSNEEPKPAIAYWSMAKHSWLHVNGPITNAYLDASPKTCGEITRN